MSGTTRGARRRYVARHRPVIARRVEWHEHASASLAHDRATLRTTCVELDVPPVAAASAVESIMHGWWLRSGGYPVGRPFHTPTGPA